jgi:hypothetical protein
MLWKTPKVARFTKNRNHSIELKKIQDVTL